MTNAFGVDHDVEKRNTSEQYASPERLATGAIFPGTHGLIAGRRKRKLRAAGHEFGGAVVGSVVPGPGTIAGGAAGTALAHRKGYYKPDEGTQRTGPILNRQSVGKSAFGVEHPEAIAKAYQEVQEQRVATGAEKQGEIRRRLGKRPKLHPLRARRLQRRDFVNIGDQHAQGVYPGRPDATPFSPDVKIRILKPGERGQFI